MMGEPAVRLALLFYLIYLLDRVKTVADLGLNFVDKFLKKYDINSNKIAPNKGKNMSKKRVYNEQAIS